MSDEKINRSRSLVDLCDRTLPGVFWDCAEEANLLEVERCAFGFFNSNGEGDTWIEVSDVPGVVLVALFAPIGSKDTSLLSVAVDKKEMVLPAADDVIAAALLDLANQIVALNKELQVAAKLLTKR